ncbi:MULTISPECIES: hypothetical protein [unclassified Pseudoalteromonas]|uniref:hypothetical protein n=1 Tax=unclassified Pseudoalteromonas TaxID=194690 RepID=UPI00257BB8D8|nr:hypothetical protein [Pseudoalteromonas sp.]|tara:strand:- start:155 stop:475 length:321 start_codon:yes stop_codon:yes gene_type:complete
METLNKKEKLLSILFGLAAAINLTVGIYLLILQGLDWLEFISCLAISLIILAGSLNPKLFFKPVKKLFSPHFTLEPIINSTVYYTIIVAGWILLFGSILLNRFWSA